MIDFTLVLGLMVVCFTAISFITLAAQAEKIDEKGVEKAYQASLTWLSQLDKQMFNESWDRSSELMKSTIQKDGWRIIMEQTRKPLGKISSREIVDKRVAKNPNGLPKGDYMVMFFKSSFENKSNAYELITLYLEGERWGIVTYQVN